ncbi:MAG: hypothetical protein K0S39_4503 [Paenibacillus sp.]|jgi:catechol-2,3-dioxygenase|nr:hypothetical protein [Paenibacillus sp.]
MTTHFRLGHAALYARDRKKLAAFYQTVFNMKAVAADDQSEVSLLAFDSETGRHDLSIVANPRSVQMTFYADSLVRLKMLWQKIRSNHIPAWGLYMQPQGISFHFHDPEGNQIEVLWPHNLWDENGALHKPHLESLDDPSLEQWVREQLVNKRF